MKMNATLGMALLVLLDLRAGVHSPLALDPEPSSPLPDPAFTNRYPSVPHPAPGQPETNSGPSRTLPDPPPTNSGAVSIPVSGWPVTNAPDPAVHYSHGITNNPLPWAVTNEPPEEDRDPQPRPVPMVADNWTGG